MHFVPYHKLRICKSLCSFPQQIKELLSRALMSELDKIVLSKINQGDIVHKVFLKPIELLLKTNKVDKSISNRQLPQGLMQALKINGITNNAFEPVNFPVLNPNTTLQTTCEENADNLISYLKYRPEKDVETSKGLELAICVCMYSENKTMLKDSIKGIEDNVGKLIVNGVNPDSIAVFVIMDGVEKVDSTVVDYFEELERESHIYLGENNVPSYTPQDIEEQAKLQSLNQFSPEQFVQKNMNTFLFSQPELEDRESRRFTRVREQYLQLRQIKNELLKLKSNKKSENLYEKLPQRVKQDFFLNVAKEHELRRLKKQGIYKIQSQLNEQQVIEDYAYNPHKCKIIATEAINKAIVFIDKYVQTREDLCYLGSFRKKIILPSHQKGKRQSAFVEEDQQGMQRYMNLFMCVKYKNAGKLSSHNWFFNGFCKELNPSYTVLMDVGLKPEQSAIYKMYHHMKTHPNVGGVCGYMRLKIEQLEEEEEIQDEDVDWLSGFTLNFVDIQKAQQMEYNLAHIIDKPFQSAFGFIHVLPGAFSGYNMKALESQGEQQKGKLLKEYFRSIEQKLVENTINETQITLTSVLLRVLLPDVLYNIFWGVQPESEEEMLYNENIYFAEDRILCMQIHKNGLELVYLPDALAEVDPIKTVHGLMGQRKRWINGSYFAFQKVKKQIGHTNQCEIVLRLQVLFYDFLNIIVYFAPAIFFFTIHISMFAFRIDVLQQILQPIAVSGETNKQLLDFFVYTVDLIYALTLMTIIYYSLNTTSNKPIFKPYIYFVSTVLGLLAISVLIVFLVDIIRGLFSGTIFLLGEKEVNQPEFFQTLLMINRWIVVGVFGIYFVPLTIYAILFREMRPLAEAIKAAISFIFYNPTYFIILSFYALCRIDDISWGTKGLNQQNSKQSKMQDKWKLIKLIHVGKYTFWNITASVLLISFSTMYYPQFYISFAIMVIIVFTIGIKIFIGLIYLVGYKFKTLCSCCQEKYTGEPQRSELSHFIEKYKQALESDITSRVGNFQGELKPKAGRKGSSYILSLKKFSINPKFNEDAIRKFKRANENRSKILKSNKTMKRSNVELKKEGELQPISEEQKQ